MAKRNKYGNTKVVVGGVKFDSVLEKDAYFLLEKMGIPFEFQVWHILHPTFKYNDNTVRATRMKIDFVVHTPWGKIVIDTKGFATDVAKLKYKHLKYQQSVLPFPDFVDIVWLHTQKEMKDYIIELYGKIKDKG